MVDNIYSQVTLEISDAGRIEKTIVGQRLPAKRNQEKEQNVPRITRSSTYIKTQDGENILGHRKSRIKYSRYVFTNIPGYNEGLHIYSNSSP